MYCYVAFEGTYLGKPLAKNVFICQFENYYIGRNVCESLTDKNVSLFINYTFIVWYYLVVFLFHLCFSKRKFLLVMYTLSLFTRISNYRKKMLGIAKYSVLKSWFQNIFWCEFLDIFFQLFSSWIKNSILLILKNIFCFLLSLKNMFWFLFNLISGQ